MLWRMIQALVSPYQSSIIFFFFFFEKQRRIPVELILKRAQGVETAVYDNFGGTTADYKAKIRSLFVNLKDKNNPALRESIISGDLGVERFSKMTSEVITKKTRWFCANTKVDLFFFPPQEMASQERKAADQKIKQENFHKSLGAEEQQAETDAFQCGRCKQVRFISLLSLLSPSDIKGFNKAQMPVPTGTNA
jgi:hypothetical protein